MFAVQFARRYLPVAAVCSAAAAWFSSKTLFSAPPPGMDYKRCEAVACHSKEELADLRRMKHGSRAASSSTASAPSQSPPVAAPLGPSSKPKPRCPLNREELGVMTWSIVRATRAAFVCSARSSDSRDV